MYPITCGSCMVYHWFSRANQLYRTVPHRLSLCTTFDPLGWVHVVKLQIGTHAQ